MQRGDAVGGVAEVDVDIGHVHAVAAVDDLDEGIVVDLADAGVKLFYDGNELGHRLEQIALRPLLKRLGKDRVVGVAADEAGGSVRG